ncbi:hypothetical protein ABZ085_19260, partial [Streptomyces albidoflavus]
RLQGADRRRLPVRHSEPPQLGVDAGDHVDRRGHRDALLAEAVDAVEETVRRLTARGLVELDEYEHRALVRDLTVAFCAGRTAGG